VLLNFKSSNKIKKYFVSSKEPFAMYKSLALSFSPTRLNDLEIFAGTETEHLLIICNAVYFIFSEF
jgi:hypothetical protein